MEDTRAGSRTRTITRVAALLRVATVAAVVVLLAKPALAAEPRSTLSPREIDARVVWVRGEAVVLAGGQATRFRIGDRVSIVDRGRALATAEVAGLTSDGIAVAHLTGGSLAKIRRLDRLRVQALSAPLRSIAMLRVGCPSIGRPCLAFPCPAPAPDLSPLASYRTEGLANGVFRMVRATAGGSEPPWPDTVMVRLFGDVADQEIALERGELDVAVFWPGEPSARARADARWRPLLGLRSRGVIAVSADGATPGGRLDARLASLNAELFGGDLLPWSERAGAPVNPPGAGGAGPDRRQFAVDTAMPGQQAIESHLNGGIALNEKAALRRLRYLDVPLDAFDAAAHDGLLAVYAIRCPILCAPALRDYVESLGANAFADLLSCGRP